MDNNPVVSIFHPPSNMIVATGFLIASNVLMTNNHVCSLYRKLQVIIYYPHKKIIMDIKRKFAKASLDFALMELFEDLGPEAEIMTLGISQSVEIDSHYRLLCPHWKVSEVVLDPLLNHGMYDESLYNRSLLMKASYKVGPGTSGSPIVDSENNVVALHWACGANKKRTERNSFSVPIDLIKKEMLKQKDKLLFLF